MQLIVWKKGDNSFYYKLVRGTYTRYYVGFKNRYNHEVVYMIDKVYVLSNEPSFKQKCIKRIIRFLQKKL